MRGFTNNALSLSTHWGGATWEMGLLCEDEFHYNSYMKTINKIYEAVMKT